MWQKLLKKADKNGDGTVSQDELTTAVSDSGNNSSSSVSDILNVFDTDKNGSITESEFTSGMQQLSQSNRPPPPPPPPTLSTDDLKKMYEQADTNGDGKVTKDELKAAMPKDSNGNGPSVDDVFSSLDTDGDGSITSSEYVTGMQKHQEEMQARFSDLQSATSTSTSSSNTLLSLLQSTGNYDQTGDVQKKVLDSLLSVVA
jgi:Ca2+-binding EF-hand superfamily protein